MWPQGRERPESSPRPTTQTESQSYAPLKRLRSACDSCHHAKTRCSGGVPCKRCADSKQQCCYSVPNRNGRPRGTKNKKTLHRLGQLQPCSIQIEEQRIDAEPFAAEVAGVSQQSPSAFAGDGPSSLDSTTDAAYSGSQPLSYFAANPSSPYWDINYDFTEDVALDGGRRSLDDIFSLTPPLSEESPTSQHDIETETCTPSSNDLQWTSDSPSAKATSEGCFSAQPESRPGSLGTCDCLHKHTELLCHVRDLDHKHTPASVDIVLISAKQILEPWKRLLKCHVCRRKDDQEVLLIAALTMRSILRLFLGLYPGHDFRTGDATAAPRLSRDQVKCSVGIYQLVGEEQALVTNILLWNTLQSIKCVMPYLRRALEYSHRRRAIVATTAVKQAVEYRNSEGSDTKHADYKHVQQIMHGMESTLQILEDILKRNSRIGRVR